jgi:hypothetical protein
MRLVMAEGTHSPRVWLEPETPDEAAALQGCAARAEWTNGRGADAVARLRALAERLGYPVRDPQGPLPLGAPCLVVVRRGERDLFEQLTAIARANITVLWDRRLAERRTMARPATVDRRQQDRRRGSSTTWTTLGFVVIPLEDASA